MLWIRIRTGTVLFLIISFKIDDTGSGPGSGSTLGQNLDPDPDSMYWLHNTGLDFTLGNG